MACGPVQNEYMAQIANDPLQQRAAARLRAAREGKGWTQHDMSRATGWDYKHRSGKHQREGAMFFTTVSMYERGERRITGAIAAVFERALSDAGPKEWFAGLLENKREAEVICALRGMPCQIFEPEMKGRLDAGGGDPAPSVEAFEHRGERAQPSHRRKRA